MSEKIHTGRKIFGGTGARAEGRSLRGSGRRPLSLLRLAGAPPSAVDAKTSLEHLRIERADRPVGQPRVLTARRPREEFEVNEPFQRLKARRRVQSPQALRLFVRDAQPWHFRVLGANAQEQIVWVFGGVVGGVHREPTCQELDGKNIPLRTAAFGRKFFHPPGGTAIVSVTQTPTAEAL